MPSWGRVARWAGMALRNKSNQALGSYDFIEPHFWSLPSHTTAANALWPLCHPLSPEVATGATEMEITSIVWCKGYNWLQLQNQKAVITAASEFVRTHLLGQNAI